MLDSRSANSQFWRHRLQLALLALNEGEVQDIVQASAVKRQGQAHTIQWYKHAAVQWVYYFVGKGYKKYVALERVSREIGQSVETLRSWEKSLKKHPVYEFDFHCARIAGVYEERLQTPEQMAILEDEVCARFYRSTTDIFRAYQFLHLSDMFSLDEVRRNLREARTTRSPHGKGTARSDTTN
jgi:hypothetical protein